MDSYTPGLAHRAPFPPCVLEVSDQSLFLGIHGNHRLAIGLMPAYFAVNELKPGVAVGILPALSGFLVRLLAVPGIAKQGTNRHMTDGMAHSAKRIGQRAQALGGPS